MPWYVVYPNTQAADLRFRCPEQPLPRGCIDTGEDYARAEAEVYRHRRQAFERAWGRRDYSRCSFCGGPSPCLRDS